MYLHTPYYGLRSTDEPAHFVAVRVKPWFRQWISGVLPCTSQTHTTASSVAQTSEPASLLFYRVFWIQLCGTCFLSCFVVFALLKRHESRTVSYALLLLFLLCLVDSLFIQSILLEFCSFQQVIDRFA